MDHHGWKVIDADAGVLWREYRFNGDALATTMVFRGTDGGLVVVSPAAHLEPADYDALRDFGEVRALVANNAFHSMGQQAWRERFQDAQSYAPPAALAPLGKNKKVKDVPFRSLAELPLPAHVRWEDPPGLKTGETVLSVGTKRGSVWYVGDLLANIAKLPPAPLKWLFTWTDSGPGFRLFKPAVWFNMKNKKVFKDWTLSRATQDPPAIVVPAHGPPCEASDVADKLRTQLARL